MERKAPELPEPVKIKNATMATRTLQALVSSPLPLVQYYQCCKGKVQVTSPSGLMAWWGRDGNGNTGLCQDVEVNP